jgi:hypothetical protein
MNPLSEAARADVVLSAVAGMGGVVNEDAEAHGRWSLVCHDSEGEILWSDEIDNVVTTVGRNLALDTFLAGSAYTVVGPFIGLISSASFSAVAAADTMASHSGWLESGGANAPTMSSNRGTAAWSAASGAAKALSAGLVFTFTGAGTVQGVFLVFGTSAVNTVGSTAGTLYSAGALGTPQPVIATNTLTITYSANM